jgi:membrane protein DedA with SNARE-associated domain
VTFSLVGSVVDIIVTILTTVGLGGLFGLMAVESFGIPPIPSEVILPFAGFLVAMGVFPLWPTLVIAVVGAIVGSYAAYAVGRWWRDRVTGMGLGPLRLQERHLKRMDDWFARHGEATVALARLVPVIRSYISYPAGSARMSPVRFGAYSAAGMIPFTLAFVYAGIYLGHRWAEVSAFFRYFDYLVIALVVAGVVYLVVVYVTRVAPEDRNVPAPASDPGGVAPGDGTPPVSTTPTQEQARQ